MSEELYWDEEGVWEHGFIIFIFSLEEAQQGPGSDGLDRERQTPEPWKSMLAKIGVYGTCGAGGYRFDEPITREEIYRTFAPFERDKDYLLLKSRDVGGTIPGLPD